LPKLTTGRWGLGLLSSSLLKKAGGELTQKEKERFEQVRQIARETLWMVICLVILESDVRELPVEKWPIGKINKIIDDIGYRGFAYDNDVVSRFWCGRGFYMGGDGVEQLFKELLGVKNVWRSLFSLTDGQKKKLSSWMERRREFGRGALEEYAHSIGVPRYCDEKTIIKLMHGKESNGDNSSVTEETEADTSSSARKAVPIKKAMPIKKAVAKKAVPAKKVAPVARKRK
ncbi:MAG: hypothetical protein IJJ84_07315, partial [Kiritimatiellae bacterium]|nr:hypothetical protein [Kiritimatiellia bacterium]